MGKLVEFGLSSSTETRAFAEEIYARLPRKNAGVNVCFDFKLLCWSHYVISFGILVNFGLCVSINHDL